MTETTAEAPAEDTAPQTLNSTQILLIAIACGALAANLYYAQPLVDMIGPSIGLGKAAEGLVVTATQVGYAAGLVFLVPLGDFFESRRLILISMLTNVVAMLGVVLTRGAASFFAAMLLVGVTSTAAQMLVPLAATLTPPERRGRIVGRVMSGLLAGILLARPAASFLADYIGWRGLFVVSAALIVIIGLALMRFLPQKPPAARSTYVALIGSLGRLVRDEPVLRRRAFYHAMLFAAFSMFWTGAPLLLLSDTYGFTSSEVALFALAGVLGVFAAPVAGWLADHRFGYVTAAGAQATVLVAFALAWFGDRSLVVLVLAAVLLDLGVQANMVISQREIFALHPAIRNRLNAVYMATFFTGGAIGSALVSPTLHSLGWHAFAALGMAFPAVAVACFLLIERRSG